MGSMWSGRLAGHTILRCIVTDGLDSRNGLENPRSMPLDRCPVPPLDGSIAKGRLQVPVTFHEIAGKTLISPPAPIPTPASPLFTEQKLSDGRQIWISAPQPDRLSLVIPISPYVYAQSLAHTVSGPEFLLGFVEHMLNPPFPVEVLEGTKYVYGSTKIEDWRASRLTFGKRESVVHFSRYKHQKLGLTLRLEMNPRKLGEQGFKQLVSLMSPWFDIAGVAKAARVTGLDIAVDVVGLWVGDIIARHSKQGQRVQYIGTDGLLETVYVNRKLPPYKPKIDKWGVKKPKALSHPAGKPLLKIYDRVREREKYGKNPPYGDAPVTRIELVRDNFKKLRLEDLSGLADQLSEVRAGYAPSQTNVMPRAWRRFYAMARTELLPFAADALDLTPKVTKTFEKALKVPVPDLVAPKTTWAAWEVALKTCGLLMLVHPAN